MTRRAGNSRLSHVECVRLAFKILSTSEAFAYTWQPSWSMGVFNTYSVASSRVIQRSSTFQAADAAMHALLSAMRPKKGERENGSEIGLGAQEFFGLEWQRSAIVCWETLLLLRKSLSSGFVVGSASLWGHLVLTRVALWGSV